MCIPVYTTYIQNIYIYKDIYILYIIHIQYCACQYLNIYVNDFISISVLYCFTKPYVYDIFSFFGKPK